MIPSSRELVLGRIGSALAPRSEAELACLEQRLADPPRLTRPAFEGDDVQRFITKAKANLASVEIVPSLADVGQAADALRRAHGLPNNVSIASALRGVAWPNDWFVNHGPGRLVEHMSITDAAAGIAETGSIVVCSASERPAGLNFLPDLHVAVLHKQDIVHHLEDVWPKIRALPVWPRAVNIISAPSRTADVAQVVVRPAHGPKELHIVLVEARS